MGAILVHYSDAAFNLPWLICSSMHLFTRSPDYSHLLFCLQVHYTKTLWSAISFRTLSGNTQILVLKDVPVESDATFYFTCQAQLLQNPDNAMWATLNTHVVLKLEQSKYLPRWHISHSGDRQCCMLIPPDRQRMVHFGKMNHVRAEDGWVEIGGDFATPSGKLDLWLFDDAQVYFMASDGFFCRHYGHRHLGDCTEPGARNGDFDLFSDPQQIASQFLLERGSKQENCHPTQRENHSEVGPRGIQALPIYHAQPSLPPKNVVTGSALQSWKPPE